MDNTPLSPPQMNPLLEKGMMQSMLTPSGDAGMVALCQGLTLDHFSAQRKHFLRATRVHFLA